jgi:dihydroorotate dehydrogenase electron transfer subunit
LLGRLRPGDNINVIYPLGNSFNLAEGKNVLIIGGGSGVAPFLLLGSELREKGTRMTFLIGGKTSKDIVLTEQLSAYGEIKITTEDGSLGEKGMVTDHTILGNKIGTYDKIYTCGPDPMMKAIAYLARDNNIECEASLENMMACGFGACLCCIVETKGGNLCVCTEGPVFNTRELTW